ncbi:MAG: hypothetical protein P0Y49_17045 [Candidatus Pedobacter colombiensis]|uniref:Uncharacterized protein n=1 Tax=Candidatus Pedobacter colombiensis TaxID=3121371 RepID=A0AAJ6B655_9SPHI|nr:hypothetical protein [Pedobacter sp.]WEK18499.1 MAG: hypothetical protein P0Y49_17045 [Pedobacter sp.]
MQLENFSTPDHSETQLISNNLPAEINYIKEYEKILQFGRDNYQNIDPIDAQNITTLLESFAELVIAG